MKPITKARELQCIEYLSSLRRSFSFSSSSHSRHFQFRNDKRNHLNPKDLVSEDNKFEEAVDVLCQQKRVKEAVELLHRTDHRPSARVYSTLIAACVRHRALELGRRVHAHTKASNFVPGVFISNRLLDMYAKCGSLVDAQMLFDEMGHRDLCSWNTMIVGYAKLGRLEQARKLFDEMPQRDNFSWNAAISGYVTHNQPREALELFRVMQRHERSNSNKFTLSSALAASAAIPCLRLGKEVHGYLIRTELNLEEVVWSALLDLYGKCGSLDEAGGIFDML